MIAMAKAGLEGFIAAETTLSHVDGAHGRLIIRGFPVEELAPQASFEEVVYLLWNDALPNAAQLDSFKERLASQRALPRAVMRLLRDAAARRLPPIIALRMASAVLDVDQPDGEVREDAERVLARFPVIVATYERLLAGQAAPEPRSDLGAAANYLYMLFDAEPPRDRVRALDTYWNTVVDHGLNASTFAARVIISTWSDLTSAVTGAVGALKGPLHGGAPGPALDTVLEIGTPEHAEPYLRQRIERGERLMGFGHRVYKVRDPRADVLNEAAILLEKTEGFKETYALARYVEKVALRLLEEYKPGRALQTNVEFYTALLLHGLALKPELFTPTFALGRVAGWVAHCFEQLKTGRIVRPESSYVGILGRSWVPLSERT
jgi:citrate synthase